jgi:hypothetical protein
MTLSNVHNSPLQNPTMKHVMWCFHSTKLHVMVFMVMPPCSLTNCYQHSKVLCLLTSVTQMKAVCPLRMFISLHGIKTTKTTTQKQQFSPQYYTTLHTLTLNESVYTQEQNVSIYLCITHPTLCQILVMEDKFGWTQLSLLHCKHTEINTLQLTY